MKLFSKISVLAVLVSTIGLTGAIANFPGINDLNDEDVLTQFRDTVKASARVFPEVRDSKEFYIYATIKKQYYKVEFSKHEDSEQGPYSVLLDSGFKFRVIDAQKENWVTYIGDIEGLNNIWRLRARLSEANEPKSWNYERN
jgi:hypothetical protein